MEVSKSYLINRVAELSSNEVILRELKSYLIDSSKNTVFNSFSISSLIILDKIRDLEFKYKGVKY